MTTEDYLNRINAGYLAEIDGVLATADGLVRDSALVRSLISEVKTHADSSKLDRALKLRKIDEDIETFTLQVAMGNHVSDKTKQTLLGKAETHPKYRTVGGIIYTHPIQEREVIAAG